MNRKMDWNHLDAFLAVANTGSLLSAAKILKISQPTIGRHISALENSINQQLFIRSNSGMVLSEAGLSLIDYAKEMKEQAQQFSLKAAGQEETISGTVRISASEIVATYILPKILAKLRQFNQQIDIELVASNAIENLLTRDADIAIRMVRPTQNDLITRKINEIQTGAWASKNYLNKFGKPNSFEDLESHQIIGYDRNDMILRAMQNMGFKANYKMFAFRTDSQIAYWELVKSGAGIGFGANFLAMQSAQLVKILTKFNIPAQPMWLTSHIELKNSKRIRLVMDFLYKELSQLKL